MRENYENIPFDLNSWSHPNLRLRRPRRNYILLVNDDALDRFRAAKTEYMRNYQGVMGGGVDWIPVGGMGSWF